MHGFLLASKQIHWDAFAGNAGVPANLKTNPNFFPAAAATQPPGRRGGRAAVAEPSFFKQRGVEGRAAAPLR